MFSKQKILGLSHGKVVRLPRTGHGQAQAIQAAKKIEADFINPINGPINSFSGGSINFFNASNYSYYLTGIIPSSPDMIDSSMLSLFYRDIYMFDSIGGSAVDILSSFPFSDWELRGLDDEQLETYSNALERIGLKQLLPEISTGFLVDGFYCGSLVFDERSKQFMDIINHDAVQCEVHASPFNNIDPEIVVHTSALMQDFLKHQSEYTKKYMQQMPQGFLRLLEQEAFALDPICTLFLGRRRLLDRAYTSYLQRLLPTYLIEKTLFRGTLTEAQRRQRATSHVQVGDDVWTPTGDELQAIIQQFQASENDPNGSWIATRNAVQVQDIRPAGDFWKWNDTVDSFTQIKLRALGLSEAFLSNDSSFSSSESAYSTFMESEASYRDTLTQKLFYNKIFPLIAVLNGFYKPGTKVRTSSVTDFLFNINNRQNLLMPTVFWNKDLTSRGEDNQFDTLQQLSELGVPIALKTWVSAAGIDYDTLLRDLKEDEDTRKELEQYMPKEAADDMADSTPYDGDFASASGATLPLDDYAKMVDATTGKLKPESKPRLTSVPQSAGLRTRKSLLSRFKGAEPEEMAWSTGDGKKHWSFNQERDRKNQNWMLAKIAARMHSDMEYRRQVAKNNAAKGIKPIDFTK